MGSDVAPGTPDAAVRIEAAAHSLAALEAESAAIVDRLSAEFQSLALLISELLRLASSAAGSLESGNTAAILAKVEALVVSAQTFVQDRLRTSAAVMHVFRDEQKLVGGLLRINAGHRSMTQEIRMLSVLTSMEVARLGDHGRGFQYLAGELQSASESVAATVSEFAQRAHSWQRIVQATERKTEAALPEIRKQLEEIASHLPQALADIKTSVKELSASPAEFRACVETVAGRISGVVSAIQFHDITRQQCEHVRDALGRIVRVWSEADMKSSAAEAALALRIQVLQLENIGDAMEAWTTRIDECLESILDVSRLRLERVAPAVFAQQRLLLSQLQVIEDIERRCEGDGAEIGEAFAGLTSLLQMVGEHTRLARLTRDRLRILSFNSIIESRKLGTSAKGMLEISRSITSIAAAWAQMAEQAEETRAEIRRLMDTANDGMQASGERDRSELRIARLDIADALAAFETAARSIAADAQSMSTLIDHLGARIESARSISQSLRYMTAGVRETIGSLEELKQSAQAVAGEEQCDLLMLEREYSRGYTTEIEREILRTALFGGTLQAHAAALSGNDVELF